MASSSFSCSEKFWKVVWGRCLSPKIQHFLWRACSGALATKLNLCKRRCGQDPLCPICLCEEESVEHLFFGCQWAQRVWFGSNVNIRINLGNVSSFEKWCEDWFVNNNDVSDVVRCYIGFTCWHIWKHRCSVVFEQIPLDPVGVCGRINYAATEFLLASDICADTDIAVRVASDVCENWSAPPAGCVKINIDGAFKEASGKGGLGVIFRNADGMVLDGFCGPCRASSALMVEALAMRKALGMVRRSGFDNVLLESDCRELLLAVEGGRCDVDWRCSVIVNDIMCMCFCFSCEERCQFGC